MIARFFQKPGFAVLFTSLQLWTWNRYAMFFLTILAQDQYQQPMTQLCCKIFFLRVEPWKKLLNAK